MYLNHLAFPAEKKKKLLIKTNFRVHNAMLWPQNTFHHSACFINQCIDHESWQKSSKTAASRISESHVGWEINWWTLLKYLNVKLLKHFITLKPPLCICFGSIHYILYAFPHFIIQYLSTQCSNPRPCTMVCHITAEAKWYLTPWLNLYRQTAEQTDLYSSV